MKLDELIRGVKGARTALIDLENFTDEELDRLQEEFHRLRERHGRLDENLLEKAENERHAGRGEPAPDTPPRRR